MEISAGGIAGGDEGAEGEDIVSVENVVVEVDVVVSPPIDYPDFLLQRADLGIWTHVLTSSVNDVWSGKSGERNDSQMYS